MQCTPARMATAEDVPELSRALLEAFRDDPMHLWLFPDERRRRAKHPQLFDQMLRQGLRHGHVLAMPDRSGAALWEAPRRPPAKLAAEVELAARTAPLFGLHLYTIVRGIRRLLRMHPHEPHWYLAMIGVDPTCQGRGAGAALMRPVLEECDAQKLPAYLEASRFENVAYYERFGFCALAEVPMPGGPSAWPMRRDPA